MLAVTAGELSPASFSLQLTLVLVYESVEVGCLPFHLLQTGFELILER